jgi:hypothetical protein
MDINCYNGIAMGKLLIILFLCGMCVGCKTQNNIAKPTLPPPIIAEAIFQGKEVQVNRLPHPFNVNGNLPFAVWVDGERVPLSRTELQAVGHTLNIQFSQPPDTAELHNGKGWLYPIPLSKDGSD